MVKIVFIVEDNELNMKLFYDLLEVYGYSIFQIWIGIEVLKLVCENYFDFILMDIQLFEVFGLEVIKWIKEDESILLILVIVVMVFVMKGDEECICQGGCEVYIFKFILVVKFLEIVCGFLGDNQSGQVGCWFFKFEIVSCLLIWWIIFIVYILFDFFVVKVYLIWGV